MPADKSKKSRGLASVPQLGDPDRKRVLNVLAQRRYRQRRREKFAALEAQAKGNVQGSDPVESHVTQPDLVLECHAPIQDAADEESASTLNMIGESDETYAMFLEQDSLELDFMHDFQAFPGLPSPLPSTPSSSSPQFPIPPDGAIIAVPLLNALRALGTIALAFDVAAHVWNPSHMHVLPQSILSRVETLPENLHPVPVQFTIPHHPVLDLLPWPSVREKLICMLSLPSAFRPPVAQEVEGDNVDETSDTAQGTAPMASSAFSVHFSGDHHVKQNTAIVRLVQDLDDFRNGGGLRVHGNTTTWNEGNELTEDVWEVGSTFYQKWWWCLDQTIVDVSNRRRRGRGLPHLRMTT